MCIQVGRTARPKISKGVLQKAHREQVGLLRLLSGSKRCIALSCVRSYLNIFCRLLTLHVCQLMLGWLIHILLSFVELANLSGIHGLIGMICI